MIYNPYNAKKIRRELLQEQNNVCGICGVHDTPEKPLVVDHDHVTGHIRGLLCYRCNGGLGMFLDDVRLLAGAIVYLEQKGLYT